MIVRQVEFTIKGNFITLGNKKDIEMDSEDAIKEDILAYINYDTKLPIKINKIWYKDVSADFPCRMNKLQFKEED